MFTPQEKVELVKLVQASKSIETGSTVLAEIVASLKARKGKPL